MGLAAWGQPIATEPLFDTETMLSVQILANAWRLENLRFEVMLIPLVTLVLVVEARA